MEKKIVTVVGATGIQGGSVIDVLLKDDKYHIRAITRNCETQSAKDLAAKGVEVVQATTNDVSSLTAAF
ncbi:NmrA family domain-containing protein 1 [Trichoderma lentiforme]|uniref:NmrA family domain-containing protein 1 n=1 Tax=Trichoderma lentiforme TaxID=1567552 RepID=A0A9P4XMB9_9HYPO|nr:NmrA family domain-containing protein 1 [Trichoderma lentiforme]